MSDFFQYDFLQRALLAGIAVAVLAPSIGLFLVVRRYALMADTLAHVALAGVAIGLLLGWQPIGTAVLAAVLAAVGIEFLRSRRGLFGESVLALFLSGGLALAVMLLSAGRMVNANLFGYLFGSITTVTPTDLWLIGALTLISSGVLAALYRPLFTVALDEDLAHVDGWPVRILNITIVALAAVVVALAMRIVGALLIGALMVIPVLAALQFKRGFLGTLIAAILLAVLAVLLGLGLSYQFDLASGATIVVVALGLFGVSLVAKR